MPVYIKSVVDRFWSKVSIRGKYEYWPWLAGTNGNVNGYGRFRVDNDRVDYAHRVALEISSNTRLIDGEDSLHRCDNPPCCNPNHLFKGSCMDNAQDRVRKGRGSCGKGERHGSVKLKTHQVLIIRRCGLSNTALARRFGVKQNTISNIRTGKTWRSVTHGLRG